MQSHRRSFQIGLILFASLGAFGFLTGTAGATSIRFVNETTAPPTPLPGATPPQTGEPDSGDGKHVVIRQNPEASQQSDSGAAGLNPVLTYVRWIGFIWASRFIGAGF